MEKCHLSLVTLSLCLWRPSTGKRNKIKGEKKGVLLRKTPLQSQKWDENTSPRCWCVNQCCVYDGHFAIRFGRKHNVTMSHPSENHEQNINENVSRNDSNPFVMEATVFDAFERSLQPMDRRPNLQSELNTPRNPQQPEQPPPETENRQPTFDQTPLTGHIPHTEPCHNQTSAQINLDNVMSTMNALIQQNVQLMNQLCSQHQQNRTMEPIGAGQTYHVMPDMSRSVRNFNGEEPKEGKAWLESLITTAKVHSWSEQIMFETARMHLEGPALSWYKSKTSSIVDWTTFRQAFLKTYSQERDMTSLWQSMRQRKQNNRESIHSYFHDKVLLCQQLRLSFSETKDQLIVGLLSDDLARVVTSRLHIDEDDLYDDMIRQERLLFDRKSMASYKHRGPGYQTPVTTVQTVQPVQSSSSLATGSDTTGNEKRRNSPRCYNCNQFGHIAKNCRGPVRERGTCFNCGSTSHKVQDCPENKNIAHRNVHVKTDNINNSVNIVHNTNSQIDDPLTPPFLAKLLYKLRVSSTNTVDYSLMALIDSGSPICLIKRSYVFPDVMEPYERNHSFVGVNGSPVDVVGIFKTECVVDNVQLTLTFYVVNDNTMFHPAILGRDYILLPIAKVPFPLVLKCKGEHVQKEFSEMLQMETVNSFQFTDELIINPAIDSNTKHKLVQTFEETYLVPGTQPVGVGVDFTMKICLANDQPITFRPRKLSFVDKQKLQSIIDDYMVRGIIEPSDSPYCNPIVLVPKKNGETRLCIDYRALNKITVKDNFPTPLIDDLLDTLKDKQYFSLLDLKSGFHHIPVDEDSRKYTSFITPIGQYQFLKMPFGLTNAPRVFQRFTNLVFGHLIRQNKLLLYLDDLLIATTDLNEHLDILREVLLCCKAHNLELRPDKCMFLFNTITYLGYCIDRDGIKPSGENIKSVHEYPVPRNQKEVHRFLGLASYFRRFVKDFSIIAKPLYDLIKKDAQFKFGEEEFTAFERIKTILTSAPVLAIYSPSSETHVYCDASSSGFGAIITQRQGDGKFKPIFYFSKRTTPAESRYHSFELECLAVVYTLQRFHVYLAGLKFKVFTDCDSFRLTLAKQSISPRISRWAMFLQSYSFEIEHRPAAKMAHVDALSRCHSVLILHANTFEQTLSIKQSQDETISSVAKKLEESEDKNFELREGLVYRKVKNRLLFYVPTCMETNVIRTCHDDLGHVGLHKVIENITRVYWFPRMTEKVRNHIDNCLKCIEFSPKSGKGEGFLHSIPKGNTPFVWLHIDHFGPLEKGEKGYKFIETIVDGFSKFVRLYPCRSTGAGEAIANLKRYFRSYSKPSRIVSDRGSAFNCEAFHSFCKEETIEFTLIATGTPRANGQAERTHRQLTPMLAKSVDSPNKWVKELPKVEFAINNTVSRSTGFTPAQLLFGKSQNGVVNDRLRQVLENMLNDEPDLEGMRQQASQNIKSNQETNETVYNRRRKAPRQYTVGDYVVIRNHDVTVGVNKKLIPKFKGPYVVKEVFSKDRYRVTDIDGFQLTQRPFTTVCGPDQMKPWFASM